MREKRVRNDVKVTVTVNGMNAIQLHMLEGLEPWQVEDYLNRVVQVVVEYMKIDDPIVVTLV